MTEYHPKAPKRRYPKGWTRLGLLVSGCCLITAIAYYAIETRPHYIEIDAGRRQWDYVIKSTVIEHEVGNAYETDNKIWMWQQSQTIFVGENAEIDDIVQEFDSLLRNQGWQLSTGGSDFSCDRYIDAYHFLNDTKERLRVYRSTKDSEVTACVYVRAALPYAEITLSTANPSPETRWGSACPFGC